jgi:integrase
MGSTRCSAPTLRIHKKTGHARCRIDGREYWLGRAGTPECEARYRALITRWARATTDAVGVSESPVVPPQSGPTTIAAALAQYLVEIKGDAAGEKLRKHARWWLARSLAATLSQYSAVRLGDFGPKMFSRWVEGVASSPMPHKRAGKEVPRTTTHVRKIVAEMLRFVEWCVAGEIVGADKLVALRSVKRLPLSSARSPVVRRPVDDAAIRKTTAKLPPVFAAIVTVCRHSAARPGEVLAIKPGEIDRTSSRGVWVWRPAKHKTQRFGRERVVVLGPRCIAALEPWLAGVPDDATVFTTDCIKRARSANTIRLRSRRSLVPITASDLRRAVRIACEAAGVPTWTPYSLRHSGLTEFRAVGGVDAAQIQAGHSQASTTERYAGADLGRAIEAARICG